MRTKLKQAVFFTSQSGLEINDSLSRLKNKFEKDATVICAEGEGIGDLVRTSSVTKTLIDNILDRYKSTALAIKTNSAEQFLVHLHACFWKKGACFTTIEHLVSQLRDLVEPKAVITLIDDFYSVYFRMRNHYAGRSITDDINPLDLLYWRATDIMLGQMLSGQLNIPHFVVAVNHPLSLLAKLLWKRHATLYAGHPITDIRRLVEKRQHRLANKLINRINQSFLVPLSKRESCATFIPDTIDETPALSLPRNSSDLQSRIWPRDWLKDEEAITLPPGSAVVDKYGPDLADSLHRNRKTYDNAIWGQIADRDYRLVNQSRSFAFVLLEKASSSLGVEQEVIQAKSYGGTKGIFFYNPDGIRRGRTSKGSPYWATNVTGESKDLDQLARRITSSVDEPLFR